MTTNIDVIDAIKNILERKLLVSFRDFINSDESLEAADARLYRLSLCRILLRNCLQKDFDHSLGSPFWFQELQSDSSVLRYIKHHRFIAICVAFPHQISLLN